MGKRPVRVVICYLDTHVAVWLAEARTRMLSHKALAYIEKAEVRISPMVVLELEYLYETQRTLLKPQQIVFRLTAEIQAAVCSYPFPIIAEVALGESWTRDPFDRLIVSHAKANGRSALIRGEKLIRSNYPETVWLGRDHSKDIVRSIYRVTAGQKGKVKVWGRCEFWRTCGDGGLKSRKSSAGPRAAQRIPELAGRPWLSLGRAVDCGVLVLGRLGPTRRVLGGACAGSGRTAQVSCAAA
jgi:PIN domain nuclease of toxin-antitoxin system